MATLLDLYLKIETLETLVQTLKTKNLKGVGITISVNDETNQFGQNVSSYVSQTKEDREAQKKKFYVGNGKVFWTDGNIKKAEKIEQADQSQNPPLPQKVDEVDELPF